MADSQERSFGEKVNTWVQTFGIILAAAWAAYTFVYKEILVPKSAPANITLNLELKKSHTNNIKDNKHKKPLVAIEMKISAKNQSSRTIYLLHNAFIVWGHKVNVSDAKYDEFLDRLSTITIRSYSSILMERHSNLGPPSVVAFGDLLCDNALKSGEMVTRSLIFHIPPREYDMLEVHAYIPSVKELSGVEVEWKFNKKDGMFPIVFRKSADGKREEIKGDSSGRYAFEEHIEFQQVQAMSMISLW